MDLHRFGLCGNIGSLFCHFSLGVSKLAGRYRHGFQMSSDVMGPVAGPWARAIGMASRSALNKIAESSKCLRSWSEFRGLVRSASPSATVDFASGPSQPTRRTRGSAQKIFMAKQSGYMSVTARPYLACT